MARCLSGITLVLPYPPSVNRYWRRAGRHIHISTEGKRYRTDVAAVFRSTGLRGLGDSARLGVDVVLMPPDRRVRDLDNAMKALLDSMEHASVFGDDSQIDELRITRGRKKLGGEVRVEVWPL